LTSLGGKKHLSGRGGKGEEVQRYLSAVNTERKIGTYAVLHRLAEKNNGKPIWVLFSVDERGRGSPLSDRHRKNR